MRIVPVQTKNIYVSDDGHSFSLEQDCVRYEELHNKYHHILKPRYKLLHNGDGKRKHCYYVESFEELKDLVWFLSISIGFRGRICEKNRYDGVWVVFDENEDYAPCMVIDDYIQEQRDGEKAYRDSVTEAVLLSANVI